MDLAVKILQTVLILVALKAIIGFHWPWERCECCGKKYRDHKKEAGNEQSDVPE